jgi:Pheromone A receptor
MHEWFKYGVLSFHAIAWNIGCCLFMAWNGLGCLIQCINSIVWNKNMIDKAPVYCDIGKPMMCCSRTFIDGFDSDPDSSRAQRRNPSLLTLY